LTAAGSIAGDPPPGPLTPARGAAAWLLGGAVTVTMAGMAVAAFRGDGTSINAYLFLAVELPHGVAGRIEAVAVALVLGLSVAALLRPVWPLLLPVTAYLFADALAAWSQRGFPFAEWAVTANAPRYLGPLALVFLATSKPWATRLGEWILRVGLAVVFAVHGLEALRLHPWFIDLLISSAANLAGFRLNEAVASGLLRVIGAVDVAIAVGLLVKPVPALLGWAAFWGAVTAWSRVTANGWGAYPEVLMRAVHYLGPLVVWCSMRAQSSGARLGLEPSAAGAAPVQKI
jgi:hypothetical protein